MKLLTEDAVLLCGHKLGVVDIIATQDLVTINGRRVLVRKDPEGRPIKGCPPAPGFKPCLITVNATAGYSRLMRIKARRVCLDTLTGLTDGTPPGSVIYNVSQPGQHLVSEL
jgi:hypothetical protein